MTAPPMANRTTVGGHDTVLAHRSPRAQGVEQLLVAARVLPVRSDVRAHHAVRTGLRAHAVRRQEAIPDCAAARVSR